MNRHTSKLNQHEQEESALHQQGNQQQTAVEFASAEEMLRHDAGQTPVPPAVAERLQRSVEQEPKPPRSLWQRLLGR
jgi:hypothetical protein